MFEHNVIYNSCFLLVGGLEFKKVNRPNVLIDMLLLSLWHYDRALLY